MLAVLADAANVAVIFRQKIADVLFFLCDNGLGAVESSAKERIVLVHGFAVCLHLSNIASTG